MSKSKNCSAFSIPPTIPGNIKGLQPHNTPQSGSGRSRGTLGFSNYHVRLTGAVPSSAIVIMLRTGEGTEGSTRHWFNLFLSLKFSKDYSKEKGYHNAGLVDAGMPMDEFFKLAKEHYSQLVADSKINFAMVSAVGFDHLIETGRELGAKQWQRLLDDPSCHIHSYLAQDKWPAFYGKLSRQNQRTFRAVLLQKAQQCPEVLTLVLDKFRLSRHEYMDIASHATYEDVRLCRGEHESAKVIAALNTMLASNRVTVIASKAFQDFMHSDQGVASIFLHKDLSVDGCDVSDLLKACDRASSLEQREDIIAKFWETLIRDCDNTLAAIKSGSEASPLLEESPAFTAIIAQCVNLSAFRKNEARGDRAIHYNEAPDFHLDVSTGNEACSIRFKEPSYEEFVAMAERFEQADPGRAMALYCRAMNTRQIQDQRSRQERIAAVRAANQATRVQLQAQEAQPLPAIPEAQPAEIRTIVRHVDPKILQRAGNLACMSSVSSSDDALIALFERHYREATQNFSSCRNKEQTLRDLSFLEVSRARIVKRKRQEYTLPDFVTTHMMDLTRHAQSPNDDMQLAWSNIQSCVPAFSALSAQVASYRLLSQNPGFQDIDRRHYHGMWLRRELFEDYYLENTHQLKFKVVLLRLSLLFVQTGRVTKQDIKNCFKFRSNQFQTGCGRFFHPPRTDREMKDAFMRFWYAQNRDGRFGLLIDPFNLEIFDAHAEQLEQLFPRPVPKLPGSSKTGLIASGAACLTLAAAGITFGVLCHTLLKNLGSNTGFIAFAASALLLLVGITLLANLKKKPAGLTPRLSNSSRSSRVFKPVKESSNEHSKSQAQGFRELVDGERVSPPPQQGTHIPTLPRREGYDPHAQDAELVDPAPGYYWSPGLLID